VSPVPNSLTESFWKAEKRQCWRRCQKSAEAVYEVERIGNNERAANFLNATRSAFELAYTI